MRTKRGSGAWIRYGERLADGEIAFAAAHYRTAILQPWETEAAARLKDLRDDMVILAYRCLSSARDFEPAHRRASGLGFAEAQRRGWLARRASGRTLEWSTYPGHYQMRVWDEAYRRRWIERVLEATAGTPFDGIMADNDVFDDYYGLDLRSLAPDDAAAPHDLAGLRAALGEFVDDVGRALTDEGLLLVPNIAEARREAGRWERHAAWGGGFDECWLGWGDKALFDEETALAQAPQLDGPGLCIVRTPSGGVGPRFDRSASALYGLAAFWVFGGGPDHIDDSAGDSESAGLAGSADPAGPVSSAGPADPAGPVSSAGPASPAGSAEARSRAAGALRLPRGAALRTYAATGADDYSRTPWFPALDADLGAPLGEAAKEDGVWRRDFEGGVVAVVLGEGRGGTVRLPAGLRAPGPTGDPDGRALGSEMPLAAGSGMIALRA